MEAPRSPLSGHYRYVGAFGAATTAPRWLGVDERTGKPVAVARVAAGRVAGYQAIREQRHPHLATVLDVLVAPPLDQLPGEQELATDEALVVSEFVRGTTLHQQLVQQGPLLPFKAVAWLLRLASAVEFLHAHDLVHGALSPRAVVAEPRGRVIAPVLAHFVAPSLGSYATPQRLRGSAPDRDGDAWALYATLFAMLTGEAPFRSQTRESLVRHVLAGSVRPLADFGLEEPLLQRLVSEGLHPNPRQRVVDLAYLSQALDAWERRIEPPAPPLRMEEAGSVPPLEEPPPADLVFDESTLAEDNGVPPVPEPATNSSVGWSVPRAPAPAEAAPAAEAPAVPIAIPRPASVPVIESRPAAAAAPRRRWPWWGLAGAAGLAAAGAAVLLTSEPAPAPAPRGALPVERPAASGGDEAPGELRRKLMSPAEIRADCIQSYFPEQAFPQRPSLGFVCDSDDFRSVARRLYALADPEAEAEAEAGTPAGAGPDAAPTVLDGGGLVVTAVSRRLLAALDWYELLTAAIIRRACCRQASLVKLPRTRGECPQLQGIVREIADASQRGVDVSHATKEFDSAVTCLFANGIEHGYPYSAPPTDTHRHAFQKFLQRAAELEAKRSKSRRQQGDVSR